MKGELKNRSSTLKKFEKFKKMKDESKRISASLPIPMDMKPSYMLEEVVLIEVFKKSVSLGLKFKYIPDDEGDGFTITIGEKSFYTAAEACSYFED